MGVSVKWRKNENDDWRISEFPNRQVAEGMVNMFSKSGYTFEIEEDDECQS